MRPEWERFKTRTKAGHVHERRNHDRQAAAQKYWEPGGDATKITDILRKKGDLQIYDADGNLVK